VQEDSQQITEYANARRQVSSVADSLAVRLKLQKKEHRIYSTQNLSRYDNFIFGVFPFKKINPGECKKDNTLLLIFDEVKAYKKWRHFGATLYIWIFFTTLSALLYIRGHVLSPLVF